MDKFKVGDRVKLTPFAIQRMILSRGKKPRPTTGVVVGFSRSGVFVRVRPDGRKSVGRYHIGFWSRVLGEV